MHTSYGVQTSQTQLVALTLGSSGYRAQLSIRRRHPDKLNSARSLGRNLICNWTQNSFSIISPEIQHSSDPVLPFCSIEGGFGSNPIIRMIQPSWKPFFSTHVFTVTIWQRIHFTRLHTPDECLAINRFASGHYHAHVMLSNNFQQINFILQPTNDDETLKLCQSTWGPVRSWFFFPP